MKTNNKVIGRTAFCSFSGSMILALGLTAIPAVAQDDSVEEVYVTGSRIARDPNLGGALPVSSLDEADIQFSGEYDIVDVVNDLPALLNSTTAEGSIGNDTLADFDIGASILDLRGLGSRRTLVLVDGLRHVGGVQGQAAVDVGSIPSQLVEKVEVLTGGASAIYGADAVTGVVNFILKDDFDGFQLNASTSVSDQGDGIQSSISGLWGSNFDDDRGNLTLAVDWQKDDGLQVSDRTNGALIGSARDWENPALRFQQGDITAGTPNLASYYDFAETGLTNFGLAIPSQADFIADYTTQFGAAPTLTAAEIALFDQAATAPSRAVLPGRTFPFTSGYGYIIPGNPFTFAGFDPEEPIDLNGNGQPDCLDSWTGYNSVFGAESFGVLGGCWNVSEDGSYAPVNDGLVAGNFSGFGGDSLNTLQQSYGDILLPSDKVTVNLLGHYDVTDSMTVFADIKKVSSEYETVNDPNSFWDLLFGAPDNPFLPDFIQPAADAYGGVAITVDPIGFGSVETTTRDTSRYVFGIEGLFDNGWTYELSFNYGLYEQENISTNMVINDRFFAAIDAVSDGSGDPACRSEVDPAAPAQNTPFEIPAYEAGYFTFTPGDGTCVPLDIWNGQAGYDDQTALDWVTVDEWDRIEIDQTVFAGVVGGDFGDFFELSGGPIAFAAGFEYREETSDAQFDPYQRGVLPAGTPFTEGALIETVSDNSSLTFRPQIKTSNETGSYDATDVFVELSLPVFESNSGESSLTLDLAGRVSDYSTVGTTSTWKTNVVAQVNPSLTLRGGVSQAVRAPNITELFGPLTGTTFRPNDPCAATQIAAIAADDPETAANYEANCIADLQSFGFDPFDGAGDYAFSDPLSAAFGGVQGGNPNLSEETADTTTAGFVFQPEGLDGFNLTVDYWEISIEDAIAAVSSQDIVDGCYIGENLNDNFCSLFTRNTDATSAQFGGFNFIQSTDINFAKIETSGIDLSSSYTWSADDHIFEISAMATQVLNLDNFTNPSDLTQIDDELGEVQRPEYAGNIYFDWTYNDLALGWQAQYVGEQLVAYLEVDSAQTLYGDSVFMDATWIHDLSANFMLSDSTLLYGGIKNVLDEDPYETNRAYPASPRGRSLFVGITHDF